jgi:hypothetical protein
MAEIDDFDIEEINKNSWSHFWAASVLAVFFGYFINWLLAFLSLILIGSDYTSDIYEQLFGSKADSFRGGDMYTFGESIYMIVFSFLHGMLLSPLRRMFFSSIRGIIKKNLS